MSIFPKILLATDGSVESELALSTAVDLANSTSSELHVVHVGSQYHPDLPTLRDPALFQERLQGLEQETQEKRCSTGRRGRSRRLGGAYKKPIIGRGEKTRRLFI